MNPVQVEHRLCPRPGCCGLKVPLHQILGGLRVQIAPRRRDESVSTHPVQAGLPHQPCDALARDVRASGMQFGVHTRCTVRATRVSMNRLDPRGEPNVATRSIKQTTPTPRIPPALRDLEQSGISWPLASRLIHAHESEERFEFSAVSVRTRPPHVVESIIIRSATRSGA
jgi:hypothetical protein